MAAPASRSAAVNPDTPVVIKVTYDGENRRFKLPLKDMGAYTLPAKLRQILAIPSDANITLERWSDSAGAHITLDSENPSIYKQLYRAAKAKLKLRIKITVIQPPPSPPASPPPAAPSPPTTMEERPSMEQAEAPKSSPVSTRGSYLDTVLGEPVPSAFPSRSSDSAADAFGSNYTYFKEKSQTNEPVKEWNEPKPWQRPIWTSPPPVNRFCFPGVPGAFCIDCNNCGATIPNEHYHCSICDQGDYDLCPSCVDAGVLCPGEGHWLIKRTISNGVVTNSTTETIAPRKHTEAAEPAETADEADSRDEETPKTEEAEETPYIEEAEPAEPEKAAEEVIKPTMRTCNACFEEYLESDLLSCVNCPDYDLCLSCLRDNIHGHHPGHGFQIIDDSIMSSSTKLLMSAYCRPGGRQAHQAICDGCDKYVVGVRHKCLDCPDFDYCSDCVEKAPEDHAGHRFVPIYESIGHSTERPDIHFGVLCDGPLCRNYSRGTYISGVRYKCTICHDTDFCANCEAHPSSTHNRTHPLIMFKTPVRHVSVSTFGEDERGTPLDAMGDRRSTKSASTETVAPLNSNAATQVQHREPQYSTLFPGPLEEERVRKTKPVEQSKPVAETKPVEEARPVEVTRPESPKATGLQAFFVKDTVVDGTTVAPGTLMTKTWTLYNPGPIAWPKGCSVRFTGGDAMFNVDTNHPTSVDNLVSAMETQELTKWIGPLGFADFTVTLKAPTRVGRSISFWHLKTADGETFGDQLWCDINVVPEPEEETVAKVTKNLAEMLPEEPTTLPADGEKSIADSDMIFPKLEKESPIASTHEAQSPAKESAHDDDHDRVEDVQSLTLEDGETEDGFLTDEEYDILDASDQEYAVEAQKSSQK